MSLPRYFDANRYNEAMQAVAAIEPCPFAGRVTPDQVKIVLGQMLDIWPDSIKEPVSDSPFIRRVNGRIEFDVDAMLAADAPDLESDS